MIPFRIKVGRDVLDPHNRRVTIIAVDGDNVRVRCAGTYGATPTYVRSLLRPLTPEMEHETFTDATRTFIRCK